MANVRRAYSDAEQIALNSQVGGHCPLCDAELFYKKKSRSYKGYELAHIYPLNPLPDEIKELKGVPLLHRDVNDPDNIIPLCESCHGKFDKPRTVEEYMQLYKIKQRLLQEAAQRELASQYPLEQQIATIVARLHGASAAGGSADELQLQPKRLDDKFNDSLPGLTQRKIKNAVADYFQHVREAFRDMERTDPASSELIMSQVRTFYLKQKKCNMSQADIFTNVVGWIRKATNAETLESAEIVAAFFVQNCEVFE